MRLIDVDALKQIHGMKDDCAECDKELRGKSKSCEYDRTYTLMDFCGWLDDMPTIEERKTEKWIEVEVFPESYDIYGNKTWSSEMQCNQCGFRHTAIEGHMAQYNFCPNCGADMRGEQDD